MNADHPLYCQAFAAQAPLMRARYATASVAQCFYAKQDVLATIALEAGQFDPAYIAKLYAELDAIRDRELSLARRVAA